MEDPSGRPELTDAVLVRSWADEPWSGWRLALLRMTGGRLNPGPGADELRLRVHLDRIRRPLAAPHLLAVTSLKGGVGKTTVTACLGLALAHHRGDRVVALDANPDAGTLADRLTGENVVTIRHLLRDLDRIGTWSELSRYTSLIGRLHVLASDQDPASGAAFDRAEYTDVTTVLTQFFDILLTDSGTGLVHSAMEGTLATADGLIVVGAPTVDAASRASRTLDWLAMHGHGHLVDRAVVVLSHDRASSQVDEGAIREHFRCRARAVVEIPHDPHLAVGGRIELRRLRPATRDAVLELAAHVADGFPDPATNRAF